jgi:hypothetical protein
MLLMDISKVDLEFGELNEFYSHAEKILESSWLYLKDRDFDAFRDQSFQFNLANFYSIYKEILVRSADHHHSFRYLKRLTDYCWELFCKDIKLQKVKFLDDDLPAKTEIFRHIMKGYACCSVFLLQENELLDINIMLDRYAFDFPKYTTEKAYKSLYIVRLKEVYKKLEDQQVSLYELYRETLQGVLNHMKTLKIVMRSKEGEENIQFRVIGNPGLEAQMELLRYFVMLCGYVDFRRFMTMPNFQSRADTLDPAKLLVQKLSGPKW